MKNKHSLFVLLLIALLIIPSCSKKTKVISNQIVVGIDSDIESLNPLFSFSGYETNISELLYIKLIQHSWNSEEGKLTDAPMLAKSWQWNSDSSAVTFKLREGVKWSDGEQVTAEDIVFSFDVFSDVEVQSKLYDTFENFNLDKERQIKLDKSFKIIDPFTLKIKFRKNAIPSLAQVDIPIIPKHIYEKLDRKKFNILEKEIKPVTNGPFSILKWDRNQSIILESNKGYFAYDSTHIAKIIFKIIPDYNSRLTQLKKGEIDLMEDLRTDDIPSLKSINYLKISPQPEREYDYIGWNNIDPKKFKKNKIVKNKFFGDRKVRKALTFAVNRKLILDEFLGDYGKISIGPVSPIYKNYYNYSIKPFAFNLDSAKILLAEAGWKDSNKDGILDKKGLKFSFPFYITSGNPRRKYAATIIKNDFKSIGIDITIKQLDLQVLMQKLFTKQLNAWMLGWVVPIPLDLAPFWSSDFDVSPVNFSSFRNKKVDNYLNKFRTVKSEKIKSELAKKIQNIIHYEQPTTFLYWINNVIAYNNRIQNLLNTPLGPIHHAWNLSVNK